MHFENVDSLQPPDVPTIERICAGGGRTLTALGQTPVYWVSPALMDELYDPWRSVLLEDECVKKALDRVKEQRDQKEEPLEGEKLIEEIEDFWKKLAECSTSVAQVRRPALGVFIQSLSEVAATAIKKARKNYGKLRTLPVAGSSAIFVCPERCVDRLQSVEATSLSRAQATGCSIAQVAFHELQHAWFRTDYALYATPWGRVIEESLCEWASVAKFETREESALLNQSLTGQHGVEYECYRYWADAGAGAALEIEASWKEQTWERLAMTGRSRRYRHFISIADELFGGDFDEFVDKNAATFGKAKVMRVFWMRAARTILEIA